MLCRKGQKASIEISMYPVTLRPIQKFFTERVHGNFHDVPSNTETNSEMFLPKWSMGIYTYPLRLRLFQKFSTERVHGNFHVSWNKNTNSEILYLKGPGKFPCTL